MPSNYTEHFKLSQWERPDKVLMDDFNDDNRKIENAFFNHPSAELIRTQTMEEDGVTWWDVDLSRVDWTRYLMVFLLVEAETLQTLRVVTDDGKANCNYITSNNNDHLSESRSVSVGRGAKRLLTLFFPFYSADTCPHFLGLGGGNLPYDTYSRITLSGGSTDMPLKEIRRFRLTKSDEPFKIGDKVTLWGVK